MDCKLVLSLSTKMQVSADLELMGIDNAKYCW